VRIELTLILWDAVSNGCKNQLNVAKINKSLPFPGGMFPGDPTFHENQPVVWEWEILHERLVFSPVKNKNGVALILGIHMRGKKMLPILQK